MSDTSILFTKASNALRDELVSQLKDENQFLKTTLYKKTNLLTGSKIQIPIRVIPNYYNAEQQAIFMLDTSSNYIIGGFDEHEEQYVKAIFIEDTNNSPHSKVLVKDAQNRIRYISVYTRHIEFIDPLINKIFDELV
jgi:hypothetical protein